MNCRVVNDDVMVGLQSLPDRSIHCCVTSPPYWGLRDYKNDRQIGLEETPDAYVSRMVEVFREVRRVLRDDGTLWLNLGDSYKSGKQMAGIPWRVAFALQADGWLLRQDLIWAKPNPMPESVRDRCTKAHEYLFLLTKSERYFFDTVAISEPSIGTKSKPRFGGSKYGDSDDPKHATKSGNAYVDKGSRNRRSVWTIPPKPFRGAHFAVMPERLAELCVLAGTSAMGCCRSCGAPIVRETSRVRVPTRPGLDTKATESALVQGNRDPLRHVTKTETTGWRPSCACGCGDAPCVVLDPFAGAGTTLAVSSRMGRDSVGIEINGDYCRLIRERIPA